MTIHRRFWLFVPAVFAVALASGCQSPGSKTPTYAPSMAAIPTQVSYEEAMRDDSRPTAETWTCPMHSQVIRSEPGKCPICGMDLDRIGDSHRTEGSGGGNSHSRSSGSGRSHSSGGGCCG
jgi:hypothetical protein